MLDLAAVWNSQVEKTFKTKQDLVVAVLREAIVTGQLPPGRRLRQEEISRQLGLSWTPVREAFRQLEVEGWLIIERHRGAVVAPLSLEDFEDIYLLRLANEPLAARLSAQRLDNQTLALMQRLHERMLQLDISRSSDWVVFLQLERDFHAAQYSATGRQRLYDLVLNLRDASERYLRASFSISDEPLQHQQVHAELLRVCLERDGPAAEATIRRALDRVLARMRPVLARLFENQ